MKELTLKDVLKIKTIRDGIKRNLLKTDDTLEYGINMILNSALKNNYIQAIVNVDGKEYAFRNTLFKNEEGNLYLLESRLFDKDENMINAYLEIIYSDGKVMEEYIDDVWEYATWKLA